MSAGITLATYETQHDEMLSKFVLPDEQKKFTATPTEALNACGKDPNRHPVVILYQGEAAGFFVLHHGPDIRPYTENPNAVLIRALSMNLAWQGRGIAKQAMKVLPGYASVHFPFCNELVLAVNQSNEAAQQLYFKTGFVDEGKRISGRIGIQLILHQDL